MGDETFYEDGLTVHFYNLKFAITGNQMEEKQK